MRTELHQVQAGLNKRWKKYLVIDIDGMSVFLQNIRVGGQSQTEHNDQLEQVLVRFKQVDLTLKKKNCILSQSYIKFLGFSLDANGIYVPDEKRK